MTSSTQENKFPFSFGDPVKCAISAQLPLQWRVLSTNSVHEHALSSLVWPCPRLTHCPEVHWRGVFLALFFSALSPVQRLNILITWLFPPLISITCLANGKINPCFQRVDDDGDDDGGKKTVYNTVGPNVCMGDHKVKTGLYGISSILFSSGGSEPSLQGPEGKRHFHPGSLVGFGPWRTERRHPCRDEQMHSFTLFLFSSPHSQCSSSSP